MGRPFAEGRALQDGRRRVESRGHPKAGAIARAVADVLEEGHSVAAAARARGVPYDRVRTEVTAARASRPR